MGGYVFDNELILVNGLITFAGLWLFSKLKIREATINKSLIQ
jgi:hypothetical protein